MAGPEIILTSDRTMISDHHGKEFLGFVATGPPIGLPEKLWLWIAAPKVRVDEDGRPIVAPYGMRKIEAALIDAGFRAAIIDPDHLHRYVETARVLMLGHHDYFAYGPPSSEWWMLTGKEPLNRVMFKRLMESPAVREMKRRGVRIIAGGPAAWQWLWEPGLWERYGVDTVVEGEAEKVVVELAEKALSGEPLPSYVYVGPGDTPSIEEIPVIKAASVNGLVEIMRGCPRGCRFCSVTLRPLRFIPLDKIREEIMVNMRAGIKGVILHSEDVLLYGADGVRPRPGPLIRLHEMVTGLIGEKGDLAWSHASLAAIKYAEEKHRLVSRLMNEYILGDHRRFIGVEVGIETGSVRLAKIIMPAKSAPYPPEKWPDIVEDAFRIMHENHIVPAATLILGLPEEKPEDVIATAELLDRLRPYRSIIVPMFFVPMGALRNRDWFRKNMVRDEHIEVMLKTLHHTLYWAEDIMNKYYLKEKHHAPLRLALKLFMKYVKWKIRKVRKQLLPAAPITAYR